MCVAASLEKPLEHPLGAAIVEDGNSAPAILQAQYSVQNGSQNGGIPAVKMTEASATVDLDSKTAMVTGDVTDDAIRAAVEEAGYQVVSIS